MPSFRIIIPNRTHPRAVDRNAVRRRIRECARVLLKSHPTLPQHITVRVSSTAIPRGKELEQFLLAGLKKSDTLRL